MKRKLVSITLIVQLLILPGIVTAQASSIDEAIKKEGLENSQIMKTMHHLADIHGPRLTGSPNHVAAANWAAKQMTAWGLQNAALEPWDFGHPGWANERASGFVTAPFRDSLVFEVLAWTPSTKGSVSGPAFNMLLPARPTQEELTNYFNSVKERVRGSIVFFGPAAKVPVSFEPQPKRIDDDVIRKRIDPTSTPMPQQGSTRQQQAPKPDALPFPRIAEQVNQFLLDNGALVRVNDAGRDHGQIRAFNNNTFDETKVVPTVVMRNEDYGRITRTLAAGTPVTLEFDIRNKTYPEGKISYNTVAEIVGTDKKDEVIMLGGHLDSWHAATGATDNAIGCAIMMEAARILKAVGAAPRRTIRVALWSGEEQGLLGSQAYVKKHFGSAESPTAAYSKFGGYFNIDSGTGRARNFSVFGPPETVAPLREVAAPFADWGLLGAINTRSRNFGGSDHTSFNNAGLPGIGVQQDPIEYFTHTWHTNLDTYERIVEDDVKKSAVAIATAVYRLATRDELLPRFKKDEMPPKPPEN